MQYHILISRINPALKIDLVRFCIIKDGSAKAFTSDEFRAFCDENSFDGLLDLISVSDISDSMYIYHSDIFKLINVIMPVTPVTLDYFDNNFVIIFDYGTEKETPKEK